ncbi:uncharacterized protein E0L32_000915 [Thyridium curvatum]|uniref:Uncharacterized protein n=1 Tax=Thyridium curvatum TaxID=1093900 RepID=A0A507B7J8_9PEZI|nr:uncharacterized protein E0L32_000915 [Thyridium curvatum]TPX12738.1 hypothetical protein E0L32_000915 [Thyridium curvatum]
MGSLSIGLRARPASADPGDLKDAKIAELRDRRFPPTTRMHHSPSSSSSSSSSAATTAALTAAAGGGGGTATPTAAMTASTSVAGPTISASIFSSSSSSTGGGSSSSGSAKASANSNPGSPAPHQQIHHNHHNHHQDHMQSSHSHSHSHPHSHSHSHHSPLIPSNNPTSSSSSPQLSSSSTSSTTPISTAIQAAAASSSSPPLPSSASSASSSPQLQQHLQACLQAPERSKLDPKDRRLAKLRHRAKTMEPPVMSFYGAQPVPLPARFASIKRKLIAGHEDAIEASWARLLAALRDEIDTVVARGAAADDGLFPSIGFADIGDPARVAAFQKSLQRWGVGVVRGVVPDAEAAAWVAETRAYLEVHQHDVRPPPPQDPTCFDFFWTPAQVRARAHPNVLRAQSWAMGLWEAEDDDRMATRFPISYADRIRIHVGDQVPPPPSQQQQQQQQRPANNSAADSVTAAAAAAADTSGTLIAQVDGGSLERWEPDGYGRGGTYDDIFRGQWEQYNPWDPTGRIVATTDLYNGLGACSVFRMFQGILALTAVRPGMVRLLPSPKLLTAYFLLRPFFAPKTPAPEVREGPEWEAFLAADNWALERPPPPPGEQAAAAASASASTSTVIHGAVPGHAQRVTELWHPHLRLHESLLAPPNLQAGDYIIWHCDTAYTIMSSAGPSRPATPAAAPSSPVAGATGASTPPSTTTATTTTTTTSQQQPQPTGAGTATPTPASVVSSAPMMVYAPACPLTQTNALYLARQRKAFLRGHPGPDFDSTGSGLGSEAEHVGRPGEAEIRETGGEEGLRAMGMAPWDLSGAEKEVQARMEVEEQEQQQQQQAEAAGEKMDVDDDDDDVEDGAAGAGKDREKDKDRGKTPAARSAAEAELVRLANIILFPDKYEFYMATRNSTPDGGKEGR